MNTKFFHKTKKKIKPTLAAKKKTSAITTIYCIFNVDIYVKLNLIVIKK